jgi:hypothetical protein
MLWILASHHRKIDSAIGSRVLGLTPVASRYVQLEFFNQTSLCKLVKPIRLTETIVCPGLGQQLVDDLLKVRVDSGQLIGVLVSVVTNLYMDMISTTGCKADLDLVKGVGECLYVWHQTIV